jgi:hypothetical protein
VAAHLAVLDAADPQAAAAYRALGRLTADRALASGLLSAEKAEPLLDALQEAQR